MLHFVFSRIKLVFITISWQPCVWVLIQLPTTSFNKRTDQKWTQQVNLLFWALFIGKQRKLQDLPVSGWSQPQSSWQGALERRDSNMPGDMLKSFFLFCFLAVLGQTWAGDNESHLSRKLSSCTLPQKVWLPAVWPYASGPDTAALSAFAQTFSTDFPRVS